MARLPARAPRMPRLARLASASLLLASLVAGFVVMNAEASRRATAAHPTVGLVNEDLPSEFNGSTYAFGANFVDRVSKDSEYNWTVLSRPIAEKAFTDGSVDAILYLPQSFSHDILTLQNVDPTKATVEYKLRPQVDEQSDRLLKSRIVDIVHGFNQSVVKMYYASVADNVAEADGHMYAALGNQEALVAALSADVKEPFAGTLPNLENFISSASGLHGVNAATVEAQNSFTESATDALTRSSEAFGAELPAIDEHANRQKQIAEINATNSNAGIARQAASDRDFYGTQYDALRDGMSCMLSGLDATDEAEPCQDANGTVPPHLAGQLAALRQAIGGYTTDYDRSVSALQATLGVIRSSLDITIANLEGLAALLEPPAGPGAPAAPSDPNAPSVPAVPLIPAFPTMDAAVVRTLKADIESLKGARNSLDDGRLPAVPAPRFHTHLGDLDAWYADTLSVIKDSALTTNTVTGLEVTDWNSFRLDGTEVYIDNSDALHRSITDLVNRTAETSTAIAGSKATVPDNSSLFAALVKGASTTFTSAATVHNGVAGLLSSGMAGLGKNQQYYDNFSTMLANTRTQGADASKIHDFFSAPIGAKNITPQRAAVPDVFDTTWLTVFGSGLVAGVLVMVLGRTFRTRRRV